MCVSWSVPEGDPVSIFASVAVRDEERLASGEHRYEKACSLKFKSIPWHNDLNLFLNAAPYPVPKLTRNGEPRVCVQGSRGTGL